MAAAKVGDDQYGEDPTVLALEDLGARVLGKEAALLVLSGTMANVVAALTHAPPGAEVIVDKDSHVQNAEAGGLAALGGLLSRRLPAGTSGFELDELAAAIRPPGGYGVPRTGLIIVENPSNRGGGSVISLDRLQAISEMGSSRGVPVHMDGSRLFNAAVALRCDPRDISAHATSVQICLTKGLCAPVGSILAGPAEFIERARRVRQMLGGGMRQAGVFAAAGIIALRDMPSRLVEDHRNARQLGELLTGIPGVHVDLETVQTNMVYADFRDLGLPSVELVHAMRERGLLALATGPTRARFVTYRGVTGRAIEFAATIVQAVIKNDIDRRFVPDRSPSGLDVPEPVDGAS